MMKIMLIGLAGLIGTLSRYWLASVVARRYGETFPTGTLVVNVIGCFLAGLLFYLMQERFQANQTMQAVVMIGLLGGFTTFSAYGLQTFTLLRDGELVLAALYLFASNTIGLLMVWAGYTVAKVF
ncbi:MAG TPA: fluoride efflux transporter CrcB [Pyrinomonadaceae bacterium]|jgi:CrcB protein